MKRNKYLLPAIIMALVSTFGFMSCGSSNADDETVSVTGVTLSDTTLNIVKGDTKTLTATVVADNATDKTLSWASADTSKVKVDSEGVVSAVDVTTSAVVVTVTTADGSFTASCEVNVTAT